MQHLIGHSTKDSNFGGKKTRDEIRAVRVHSNWSFVASTKVSKNDILTMQEL